MVSSQVTRNGNGIDPTPGESDQIDFTDWIFLVDAAVSSTVQCIEQCRIYSKQRKLKEAVEGLIAFSVEAVANKAGNTRVGAEVAKVFIRRRFVTHGPSQAELEELEGRF